MFAVFSSFIDEIIYDTGIENDKIVERDEYATLNRPPACRYDPFMKNTLVIIPYTLHV